MHQRSFIKVSKVKNSIYAILNESIPKMCKLESNFSNSLVAKLENKKA